MIEVSTTLEGDTVVGKVVGRIKASDWDAVAPLIDEKIRAHGPIKLFLDASELQGWEDLEAARAHFRFIKAHHENVERLAILADKHWLRWLAGVGRQFLNAEVRAFESNDREFAERWLATGEYTESGLSISWDTENRIVTLSVFGKLTGSDYRAILLPAMEEAIEELGQLRCLIDLSEFTGLDFSAFWEDLKFGLGNASHMEKIAIISDRQWVEWAAKAGGLVTPAKIQAFDATERLEARRWLTAEAL